MYYKLYTNQKKVPAWAGFLLIFLIVFGFKQIFGYKPIEKKIFPKARLASVEITNLTHNAATICWASVESAYGHVIYGSEPDRLDESVYDDRSLAENQDQRFHSCATIRNLTPNTAYYFKVSLNGSVIDRAFNLTTAPLYRIGQAKDPVICKVLSPSGKPVKGGVVYVRFNKAYTLSGFIKETGECLIPLYYVVSYETQELISLDANTPVTLDFFDSTNRTSRITTVVDKLSPLTPIVIGKNYSAADFETGLQFAIESKIDQSAKKAEFDIIFPKDKARIAGLRPLIKGVALANTDVKVRIDSDKKNQVTVRSDKKGIWNFTLTANLKPGTHLITATSKNSKGREVILSRSFTILKSGESVLGVATPEATLSPSGTPTPSPTVAVVTPTAVPVTETPGVTEVVATPTDSPPISGNNFMPFVGLSSALVIVGLGLLMVF